MEKELELLQTFPKVSKEAWKQKTIEDLKGADFDRKLVWKTYEGIAVQPFYTQEDTENKQLPSDILNLPDAGNRNWVNYIEIKVTDALAANKLAAKMLQFDATGILFYLSNPETTDPAILLQGLPLASLNISFKTETPNATFIKSYFAFCAAQGISLNDIKGFYQSDVLENLITTGNTPDYSAYTAIIEETLKAPNFYGITLTSHAFADSGATAVQEIAWLGNKLVDYITTLTELTGVSAAALLTNIYLHTATGGDYFFEISKLRALRLLFQTIGGYYEAPDTAVQILASSGLWTKSLFDPNVNMLRNTTEAMAALLGGCNAILVQPHDSSFKETTDFSHRIALNLSNLLKEEAYFDKVTDPAAGSYYIENLTQSLYEKAVDLFKETEAAGGFTKAFESGLIKKAIDESRTKKEADISSRRKVFVGSNKYPNLKETIDYTAPETLQEDALLVPQRGTKAFDELRLATISHYKNTGYIPKVYMACFGNLAMRKARATFSAEFFGIAGFEILGEFIADTIEDAAKKAAASDGDIVVLCASDPDYENSAAEFAGIFKQNAPEKQLVLAGWPAEIVEQLKEAGVDSFVHMKVNAIDALSNYQQMLFQTAKSL